MDTIKRKREALKGLEGFTDKDVEEMSDEAVEDEYYRLFQAN